MLENLSQSTQQSLTLLIYATTVMLIFISILLAKLLIDLSSLAKSLQNLVVIVNNDIGPTIKELKRALININTITTSTSTQFKGLNTALNEGLNVISNSTKGLSERAGIVLSSLRQGLYAGLKVFLEGKERR